MREFRERGGNSSCSARLEFFRNFPKISTGWGARGFDGVRRGARGCEIPRKPDNSYKNSTAGWRKYARSRSRIQTKITTGMGCDGVRGGAKGREGVRKSKTTLSMVGRARSNRISCLRAQTDSPGEKEIDIEEIIPLQCGISVRTWAVLKLRADTTGETLAAHPFRADKPHIQKRMTNRSPEYTNPLNPGEVSPPTKIWRPFGNL